jgi:hypothetical protein
VWFVVKIGIPARQRIKLDKRVAKVFNTDMRPSLVRRHGQTQVAASGYRTKHPLALLFLSIAGAMLNMLIYHFLRNRLGIPR